MSRPTSLLLSLMVHFKFQILLIDLALRFSSFWTIEDFHFFLFWTWPRYLHFYILLTFVCWSERSGSCFISPQSVIFVLLLNTNMITLPLTGTICLKNKVNLFTWLFEKLHIQVKFWLPNFTCNHPNSLTPYCGSNSPGVIPQHSIQCRTFNLRNFI